MALQASSSAFKHRSLLLHFRSLLGCLGHHFESFGWSFWKPESFILGPWEPLGTLKKAVLKHSSKRVVASPVAGVHFGAILDPFFKYVLVDFSVRFLDHFWSHFGTILGAKMEPTSITNRFKIRSKFQSDFGVVPGPFFVN